MGTLIIPMVAVLEIPNLLLASVSKNAGLSLTSSKTSEDRFFLDVCGSYLSEPAA